MGRRIGIRVADGTFYPVFDDDEDGRRRIVVTTAQDDQTVLRIQVVREDDADGVATLGTLEFDGIEPAPKSDADIELLVGVDAGTLSVRARDIVSGEKHELSVSLTDADFDVYDLGIESGSAAIKEEVVVDDDLAPPEFDAEDFDTADLGDEEFAAGVPADEPDLGEDGLDDEFDLGTPALEGQVPAASKEVPLRPPASSDSFLDDDLTGDAYPMGAADSRRTHLSRRRRGRLWMGAIIVGALIILAVAAVVVIRGLVTEGSPPWVASIASWADVVLGERAPAQWAADTGTDSGAQGASDDSRAGTGTQSASGAAGSAVVDDAPARDSPAAAISSSGSTPSGKVRTVRRGDTLWDLANSYYRNPWKYREIARRNNISNPDLIEAGTQIFIPEL